jgi:hypothetical protein
VDATDANHAMDDADDAALQVALRESLDQLGYDDEERAQLAAAERLSLAELLAGAPPPERRLPHALGAAAAAAAVAPAPAPMPRVAAPRTAPATADGMVGAARVVALEADVRRRAGLPDPPRRPADAVAPMPTPNAPPRAAPQAAAAAAAGARFAADEARQAECRAAEAEAARANAAAASARHEQQRREQAPPPPRMLPFNAPPLAVDIGLQDARQLMQEQARAVLRSRCEAARTTTQTLLAKCNTPATPAAACPFPRATER